MFKRFIYLYWYRIQQVFQSQRKRMHEFHTRCIEHKVYEKLKDDAFTIFVNGLLIWIALIPFVGYSKPWFAISYGVLVFWVTAYIMYMRKEFTK